MQRLSALRNIDMAITSSLDMRISIEIILNGVANQLHMDACDILFLNPHTQTLEYIAGRGFNTDALRYTRYDWAKAMPELLHLKKHDSSHGLIKGGRWICALSTLVEGRIC